MKCFLSRKRCLSAMFSIAASCCFVTEKSSILSVAFVPAQHSHYPFPSGLNTLKNGISFIESSTVIFPLPLSKRHRKSSLRMIHGKGNLDGISDPGKKNSQLPTSKKFQASAVAATLTLAILFAPLQAHAGFGPSGGATTSTTPGIQKVNVQELSPRKLQQLIDSLNSDKNLGDLQSQFQSIIDNLANSITSDEDEGEDNTPSSRPEAAVESIKPRLKKALDPGEEERLEKARDYQTQIVNRERMLDKLAAQPWYFNLFAAFCGSVASTLVVHPIDTIKTRLQILKSNSTDDEDNESETKLFQNLYEGLAGNVLKEGPPSAVYLGVYESVKMALLKGQLAPFWASLFGSGTGPAVVQVVSTADPSYLLSIYLAAGAAGELVGSTIRAPAEAMKSMIQSQLASNTQEAFDMILVQPEGRSNLFRAWSSSALRDIPFGAIQLALFELIKAYILNNPNIEIDSSTLQSEAVIGAIAGGIGSFLTNPLDVITTRIITQDTRGDEEPLGVFEMGKLIFEEGGPGAFFTAWQARVLYWAPAISLFLTCYCTVRQLGVKLDLFS